LGLESGRFWRNSPKKQSRKVVTIGTLGALCPPWVNGCGGTHGCGLGRRVVGICRRRGRLLSGRSWKHPPQNKSPSSLEGVVGVLTRAEDYLTREEGDGLRFKRGAVASLHCFRLRVCVLSLRRKEERRRFLCSVHESPLERRRLLKLVLMDPERGK
jgi:hypothetical protein